MEHRFLGNSGMRVSAISYGNWLTHGSQIDDDVAIEAVHAALDAGITTFDTADVYAGTKAESVLGEALRGVQRESIELFTKVFWPTGPGVNQQGLSRKHIMESVEGSLRRLGTDHIDLYQAHTDDADTPLEDTLGAFADLIRAGKVRAIGASNHSAARLQQALDTSTRLNLPRYQTLQPLFNLMDRAPYEAELQPLCVREGVGVINYYGLAMGFLSGKYRHNDDATLSPRGARVLASYGNDRGWRVLAALDTVSARTGAPPAQVALAWQLRQPGIVAPIASATSLAQWRQLAGAATLQLSDEDMAALTAASA